MTLTKAQVALVGTWDKGGRFHFKPEFRTLTSDAVRSPSRRWPYSEYKHALTAKYAASLSDAQRAALKI